jgi:DNA-binding HxlR family transcriptional regulator
VAGPADLDFDYRAIDELIHGRVRLAVMAFLSGAGSATFGELQRHAQVSEGNLSVHLRKLEDGGYVDAEKKFVSRKPQTLYHLTERGRSAWIAYIDHIQKLLGAAGGASPP